MAEGSAPLHCLDTIVKLATSTAHPASDAAFDIIQKLCFDAQVKPTFGARFRPLIVDNSSFLTGATLFIIKYL
jgi:hypothetical protein